MVKSTLPRQGVEPEPGERSRRCLERSRRAILNGWVISMIGVVLYCLATVDNPAYDDGPWSALTQSGPVGWAAPVFLVVGLGLWLAGSIAYVSEAASCEEGEDVDW